MTKVNVISGFLGAGKTTLIKKLLDEALQGEKIVLIENEFGEIGIDGGFLKDAGVEISEMNSGCICCSLVGDFGEALKKVMEQFHPDRILIEPSGVGKLSDVIRAVQGVAEQMPEMTLGCAVTVADASKCTPTKSNTPGLSSSAAPRSWTADGWRPPWPCCGRRMGRPPLSPPPGISSQARSCSPPWRRATHWPRNSWIMSTVGAATMATGMTMASAATTTMSMSTASAATTITSMTTANAATTIMSMGMSTESAATMITSIIMTTTITTATMLMRCSPAGG